MTITSIYLLLIYGKKKLLSKFVFISDGVFFFYFYASEKRMLYLFIHKIVVVERDSLWTVIKNSTFSRFYNERWPICWFISPPSQVTASTSSDRPGQFLHFFNNVYICTRTPFFLSIIVVLIFWRDTSECKNNLFMSTMKSFCWKKNSFVSRFYFLVLFKIRYSSDFF